MKRKNSLPCHSSPSGQDCPGYPGSSSPGASFPFSLVFFFKQTTAYEISECDWSLYVCFFFFKQKTAYEISECDWSSDVCSSDLNSSHKQKTAYEISECDWSSDRKSTRLNSSHIQKSRMPSSACDWSSDVCSSDQIG